MKIWKFWRKVVGRQIILAANQTYKELLKKGKVGRKNLFRWVNLSANELYMRGAGGPKLEAALGRSPICGFANSQPQTHRPQPSQHMNETKRWWRWTDTHREFMILGDQFQSFWKVNCNIVCKFFFLKNIDFVSCLLTLGSDICSSLPLDVLARGWFSFPLALPRIMDFSFLHSFPRKTCGG